jgi:hypothetical protein
VAENGTWRDFLKGVASRLDQPVTALRKLLEELVARAVTAVGSADGSILTPDADGRNLGFFVSHSPVASKLVEMKVPIEGSIAGYVFSTGQMTAVGDLAEEKPAMFYPEVSKTTGIATRTYLVVPILLAGRSHGVATYVNRPGQPPYQPFQTEEMTRAQAFAAVEAVVLSYLERTAHLARIAAQEMTEAWRLIDPAEPAPFSPRQQGAEAGEPWARVIRALEHLPETDQAFCADLVALVAQRREGGLA